MRKFEKLAYLIILITTYSLFFVCSKKNDKIKGSLQRVAFADSNVMAIINNEKIFKQDVEVAAEQIVQQTGLANKVDYTDSLVEKQALDLLVTKILLKQEIKNYTIEIAQAEIDHAIEQFKRNFASDTEYEEKLKKEGLTIEQFRQNIKTELQINKLLEIEIKNESIQITKEEANNFYLKNSDKFLTHEKVHARHILIRLDKDASQANKTKARKKAESVLRKLKNGSDFSELAQKYSEGPSASKGGDLGYFSKGDMVKTFEDKVFSMKPGEISDVVETQLGFHIIKLEDYKGAGKKSFEEVEEDIKAYLKVKKANEMFEDYIEKLKLKAHIQVRADV